MLRTTTTKVIPLGNHSLLDEVAIAIEAMEEGSLILDVLMDEEEREALIIHACDEEEEEEDD